MSEYVKIAVVALVVMALANRITPVKNLVNPA